MGSYDNTVLSEAYGGDWADSPSPIWQRLSDSAQHHADKLALACLHQPADLYGYASLTDSHLQWSYSQLASAANSLGTGLTAHGLSRGSSIVTILDNGAEFPLSFWAAHKLGCTFVPLNPRNLSNATEARHMLGVVDAAAVIVGSAELAAAFDALTYRSERDSLKICVERTGLSGWLDFSDLLTTKSDHEPETEELRFPPASTKGPETAVQTDQAQQDDEPVTVLFTSGTTSLPKGCPHTDLTLNAFTKNLALGGCSPNDAFCAVLPNNHAMGYFYVLHFLCEGGAVVYPSPTFNAEQTARALKAHSCSHTCLVPTALHSLLDLARRDASRFPALKDVCLAGASITPQHLRQVTSELGSSAVSTGFGMTEGSPIWTAATSDPETLVAGEDTISGQASPGAHIRICASESNVPLPRGVPGEIHESGPGVIGRYLGGDVGSESFYQDERRTWFRTGDRAFMHADGRVSVVGRYKDMIIRGGENIAPAAIESILNQFPGVEAQVVAAADDIAGEVPVAIVRGLPVYESPETLQAAIRTSMGMLHVPDEIVTLEALGLDDYPRTMSGKIQKATLRNLVAAFRKHPGSATSQSPSSVKSIEETVLHVWWRATGILPASLDKQAPTSNFADSITIMRVRDMYRKELGLTLSAQEMIEHSNLQGQIVALQEKSGHGRKDSGHQVDIEAPSPTLEEIQVVVGPENDAASFKEAASSALANQGFNFDEDVDAVIQTSDFTNVLIRHKIMDTWNFGIAIVAEGSTVPALQQALISALKQSPLWPSFYVFGDDGSPFYVTMKRKQKLYDHCLTVCGSVATLADLQQVAIQYPHREHSTYPGLLFHARLYHVEELNSAAFVMYLHHSVHDASSMRLVLEDINTSLREPDRPLRSHVPFKTWADIYHSLRDSPRATMEVNWHVNRLSTLHLHRKALYPPAHVPRQATTANPDGIDYGFDAPALLTLKQHHPHITASVVLKAAMALVNITRTNHSHALFSNFEAARSTLPFWPTTLRHLPSAQGTTLSDLDASDVAGPTMNAVTNLIPVPRSESALAFLSRLQKDQTNLTAHSQAPWRRVISKLNALHPGENAGSLLPETHQTQFLTWVPGFLGDYEKLRVAQIAIRAALGMCFVAGLGGPRATTFMISLRWDVANFSQGEVQAFVEDVEKAIAWLLDEGSWGLALGEFLGRF